MHNVAHFLASTINWGDVSMGIAINDSTTLDILVQLNKRFEPEGLTEMIALQKEFQIFSAKHSLQSSFALLGIVPVDWSDVGTASWNNSGPTRRI
jgi:hypothetical protein